MAENDYLKPEELKIGYLYRIDARNASIGIWRGFKKGDFVISRYKFGQNYLFEEIHWDLSPDFGTVKPLYEIEESPFVEYDLEYVEWMGDNGLCWGYARGTEILDYLNDKIKELNDV